MGEKSERYILDVHFGGMFSEYKGENITKMNPSKAKRNVVKFLNGKKDIVRELWAIEKEWLSGIKGNVFDVSFMKFVEGESRLISFSWESPIIFHLKVDKGFKFLQVNGEKSILRSPLEAIVVYGGVWFMCLIDRNQFKNVEDLIFSGPTVRDILVNMMSKNNTIKPKVIAPCIIPARVLVEVIVKSGRKSRKGKSLTEYIDSSTSKLSGGLVLEYKKEGNGVTSEDIARVGEDIYQSINRPFNRFYLLKSKADEEQDKREKVLELYKDTCEHLKKYLLTPFWNILKKSWVANSLGRDISNLQIQLVDNRLSQIKIIKESEEINDLQDSKGIIDTMRKYLKGCIVERFEHVNIEFEGLNEVLSHVGRVSSEHNVILLGMVAIAAGFIGAVIGAWLGS